MYTELTLIYLETAPVTLTYCQVRVCAGGSDVGAEYLGQPGSVRRKVRQRCSASTAAMTSHSAQKTNTSLSGDQQLSCKCNKPRRARDDVITYINHPC